MLKLLTDDDRKKRMACSKEFLKRCGDEPGPIIERIVTADETMVLYFDPLSKMESMVWRHPTDPRHVKATVQQSHRKIMATVLLDCRGF